MISKGGIIDPLHRQVPSIASLEWIKVFFSPLSPPLRERLYNQSISVTYMGSLGAKSPLLKSSQSKGIWSNDCWIEGPWGTFMASQEMQQLGLDALSFIRHGNSSIPSLICGIFYKLPICVGVLSMKKSWNGCFIDSQPAVQHHASHCNQQWWSDGCSDTLTDCFFPPLLPADMPHGSCLLFHELCYSSWAVKSSY